MFGPEDLASQYGSIFDSTNSSIGGGSIYEKSVDPSDNNLTGSVYSELNPKEKRIGNFSILDQMRGLTPARLDNSNEASLAEQYQDSMLDRRFFNGRYNVTLFDIYQDKRLYKAHHGLYYEGYTKAEANPYLEGDMAIQNAPKEENEGGLVGLLFNKDKNDQNTYENGSNNTSKEISTKNKTSSPVNGNSDQSSPKGDSVSSPDRVILSQSPANRAFRDEIKIKDESGKSRIRKNSKISDSQEVEGYVPLSQEIDKSSETNIVKLREIEARYGKDILSDEEKKEFIETGRSSSAVFMSYSKIVNKINEIEDTISSGEINEVEKNIMEKKLSRLKTVLKKKVFE